MQYTMLEQKFTQMSNSLSLTSYPIFNFYGFSDQKYKYQLRLNTDQLKLNISFHCIKKKTNLNFEIMSTFIKVSKPLQFEKD